MLLLKEFFHELSEVNLTDNQNWKMYDNMHKSKRYHNPEENVELRLEFNRKWKRIIRGLDLLTDKELIFLYDYYSGKYITGIDELNDNKLFNIIYSVENAA